MYHSAKELHTNINIQHFNSLSWKNLYMYIDHWVNLFSIYFQTFIFREFMYLLIFLCIINNFLLYVKVTDGKDTIMRSVQSIWFLWRCEAYSTLVSQLRDTHTVICYSLTLLDSSGPLLLTSVWIVQWLTSVKFPAPSGQPSSWRSSTTAEFSVKQKFMNIMEYRQYWIISVMTNTCTNITQEINLSKTIA